MTPATIQWLTLLGSHVYDVIVARCAPVLSRAGTAGQGLLALQILRSVHGPSCSPHHICLQVQAVQRNILSFLSDADVIRSNSQAEVHARRSPRRDAQFAQATSDTDERTVTLLHVRKLEDHIQRCASVFTGWLESDVSETPLADTLTQHQHAVAEPGLRRPPGRSHKSER